MLGFAVDLSLPLGYRAFLKACAFTHTRLNEEECIAGWMKNSERETSGVRTGDIFLGKRSTLYH